LMMNHFHLIVETPNGNLSKIMHHLNGSYTTYINVKRKRSGHLFQGRYKALMVDKNRYLLELSRYLHMNPVRANMVARPEEYPYSSYDSYVSDKKEEIVSTDLVLGMMSASENFGEKYRAYVESCLVDELPNPLATVYGGVLLSSGEFTYDILTRLKEDQTINAEVSRGRELRVSSDEERIVAILNGYYGITPSEAAADRHGEARNVGVYLLKKFAGVTNVRIGELYGGLSCNAGQ
jgi:putative transposase